MWHNDQKLVQAHNLISFYKPIYTKKVKHKITKIILYNRVTVGPARSYKNLNARYSYPVKQ